jgi:hypothetical protein
MANSLGSALSGLSKPGSGVSKKASPAVKRGSATITVEPMPVKPKTFTDKNLEPGFGVGGANGVKTQGAKPGGTIRPEINATPKMKLPTPAMTKA